MKKLIMVNASPHKDGGCSLMLEQVAAGAREAGYEVVSFTLNDMDFRNCQGCGTCKRNGVDCVLEDGLKPYWAELHSADALAVGSPNYCSLVSGTFLSYMARHYCLLWEKGCRLHPGVKLIGCFSQGRSELDTYIPHYDEILKDFENRDMKRHALIVYSPTLSEEEREGILQKAREAGRSL